VLFQDVIQQFPARAVNHLVDLFESVWPAVIGVRDFGSRPAFRIELTEEVKSGLASNTFSESVQMREVRLVHGHDIVEPRKVLGLNLPCVTGEGDTLGGRTPHGPVIRAFPYVPASGSGRVNLEPIRDPLFVEDVSKYTFRQGRSADVAEANKEDGDLLGHTRASWVFRLKRLPGSK